MKIQLCCDDEILKAYKDKKQALIQLPFKDPASFFLLIDRKFYQIEEGIKFLEGSDEE